MSDRRRSTALAALLLAPALLLTGCTGAAPAPSPSAPPASDAPTPDPSAAAAAAADADEALLPMPVEAIAEWSDAAVPGREDAGHVGTHTGWLSEHTSRNLTIENRSTPAGSYALQLACRGDGVITATFESLAGEPLTDAASERCADSTVAFAISTTEEGVVSRLSLEGAPTVYALSFQEAGALDQP